MQKQVALPRFTRTDYDQLPEDLRVELIGGEILKMASPTWGHQDLVGRIFAALLEAEATAVPGPVDFGIDESNVLVPDVVAVESKPPKGARGIDTALAVFEVLSPSTAARDRKIKTDLYLEAGVQEVWLVDPKSETIAVHRARESRVYADDDTADSRAVPGFRLVPATLFAERA